LQDWDEYVRGKLDGLADDVAEIKVILAAQHITLEDHQRRSIANERATDLLTAEVKPIKQHIAVFTGVLKGFGVLAGATGTLLGVITAVLKLLGRL
jgi:hypothetical protein